MTVNKRWHTHSASSARFWRRAGKRQRQRFALRAGMARSVAPPLAVRLFFFFFFLRDAQ